MKKYENVGLVLLGTVLYIGGLILCGFTIMCLFNWFIADVFRIKRITILIGIGIDVLITLLTSHKVNNYENKNGYSIDIIIQNIGTTSFYLLFGFVIHLFI